MSRDIEGLLTIKEREWIEDNQEKCEACGHLEIFEISDEDRNWCLVSDCFCVNGIMPSDKEIQENKERVEFMINQNKKLKDIVDNVTFY